MHSRRNSVRLLFESLMGEARQHATDPNTAGIIEEFGFSSTIVGTNVLAVIIWIPVFSFFVMNGIFLPGMMCDKSSSSRFQEVDRVCESYMLAASLLAFAVGIFVGLRFYFIFRNNDKTRIKRRTSLSMEEHQHRKYSIASLIQILKTPNVIEFDPQARSKLERILFWFMVFLSILALPCHSLGFAHAAAWYPVLYRALLPDCKEDSTCEKYMGVFLHTSLRSEEIFISLSSMIWTIMSVNFMSTNLNLPHQRVVNYIKIIIVLLIFSCTLRACVGGRFLISNLLFDGALIYFAYAGCRRKHCLESENSLLRFLKKENSNLHSEVYKRDFEKSLNEEASDLILLNSFAPIFSLDAQGFVIMWNHGMSRLTKLAESKALGRHMCEMPFDLASQNILMDTLQSGYKGSSNMVSPTVSLGLFVVGNESQVIQVKSICFFRWDEQSKCAGVLCSGIVNTHREEIPRIDDALPNKNKIDAAHCFYDPDQIDCSLSTSHSTSSDDHIARIVQVSERRDAMTDSYDAFLTKDAIMNLDQTAELSQEPGLDFKNYHLNPLKWNNSTFEFVRTGDNVSVDGAERGAAQGSCSVSSITGSDGTMISMRD